MDQGRGELGATYRRSLGRRRVEIKSAPTKKKKRKADLVEGGNFHTIVGGLESRKHWKGRWGADPVL